jgi:hypothetical protein
MMLRWPPAAAIDSEHEDRKALAVLDHIPESKQLWLGDDHHGALLVTAQLRGFEFYSYDMPGTTDAAAYIDIRETKALIRFLKKSMRGQCRPVLRPGATMRRVLLAAGALFRGGPY